jgi:hypothetical protein
MPVNVFQMESALIFQVEIVYGDSEVDKRLKSIGCQGHDSLVVFKEPKEDITESISMHV